MSELARVVYATHERGIARLTLDRPAKRNALDAATIAELKAGLERAEADAGVRVIALAANGPDFCAGADLSELERIAAGAGPLENLADAQALGDLFVRMRRCPKPVVALVHGHAVAGGAGLATAADIVLARSDAVFGYPEIHLGFVPAMVMALLRRSVGEKVAFDLATGGHRFDAEEARRLGLVNRVWSEDTFDGEAAAFLEGLVGRSASALALIKRLLYGSEGLSFEDAIARGAEANALARMTPDTLAGVRRFLDRRRP
jgi:methylglutaconyl-CoA hydratase